MADDIKRVPSDAAAATMGWDEGSEEDRWPIPHSAMLVTASSVVLWALIIAGARWLLIG